MVFVALQKSRHYSSYLDYVSDYRMDIHTYGYFDFKCLGSVFKCASTLCHTTECNKMQPCRVANGENNVDVNGVQLKQGFCMPQHAMRHENSIGKMSVSSKVSRAAYDD